MGAAALETDLAMKRPREQAVAIESRSRLGAAVGIMNGLIGGIAFWVVGYGLFNLGRIVV